MRQARWSMRSGLGRWLGGSGRPRILAAAEAEADSASGSTGCAGWQPAIIGITKDLRCDRELGPSSSASPDGKSAPAAPAIPLTALPTSHAGGRDEAALRPRTERSSRPFRPMW